jgi:hypothetical protein
MKRLKMPAKRTKKSAKRTKKLAKRTKSSFCQIEAEKLGESLIAVKLK